MGYDLITTHRLSGVKSKLFPKKRIFEKFRTDYISDTISYMIAYAIYKGATRIETYGIQMSTPVEFRRQRACCEYWLGYAEGKGIETYVHRPSQLLYHKEGLYGIEWDNMERGSAYPDAIISPQNDGVLFTKI